MTRQDGATLPEPERMVAQIFTSLNPLTSWLRQIECLRLTA
jgi:hypothetical protein